MSRARQGGCESAHGERSSHFSRSLSFLQAASNLQLGLAASAAAISPRPATLSARELFISEMAVIESPHAWRKLAEALVRGLRRFHTQRCEAKFAAVLIELPDPSR